MNEIRENKNTGCENNQVSFELKNLPTNGSLLNSLFSTFKISTRKDPVSKTAAARLIQRLKSNCKKSR